MSMRLTIQRLLAQEDLNFLLTNRLPRLWLTRFMGWFSKIEQPWVRDLSIRLWRWFSDLDLSESRKTSFSSMHDCFTRELKPGLRPVDAAPGVLSSPSDGILGAYGSIRGTQVFQVKGFPYCLTDLLGEDAAASTWDEGVFATLRLTSGMYHRLHAPQDCKIERVRYFSGDTWNVNPIALKRVEKLFCKNERAFIQARIEGDGPAQGQILGLVPVAAILVAGIRLHFLDVPLHLRRHGPGLVHCAAQLAKGQEMGWFEHGSTVIVLAPKGFAIAQGLHEGSRIKMGQALMRWQDHV